jgi:mono/diheme cytochrome c family protein
MSAVLGALVLAQVQRTIGIVLAVLLILAFLVAIVANMRKGRREVGAEIELAPNRLPGTPDDELETKRLDRTLGLGLAGLAVIAVTLPLYWLAEPGRQEGAVEKFNEEFVSRGEELFVEGAQCASCHGPEGVGGAASYTLTADNGDFIASVEWQAPALNTVMYRYTTEQVKNILDYGRPGTPMPAWGANGGGPLTTQQLDNIIDYLYTIQLPAEEAEAERDEAIEAACAPDDEGLCTIPDPASPDGAVRYANVGEAIFNLGLYDKFAGGAYSCGRCHTQGWSYGQPGLAGGGAFGPDLRDGRTLRQFLTPLSQIDFVSVYHPMGSAYGVRGISSGRMPGFGVNPNAEDPDETRVAVGQVMLTEEQIAAVVAYERSL